MEENNVMPSAALSKTIVPPKRKKKIDPWVVVLPNLVLITQLEEVEVNQNNLEDKNREPNCRMIEPFVILDTSNYTLSPYLIEYTNENNFMIHSDKIITLTKPNAVLQSKYESLLNG